MTGCGDQPPDIQAGFANLRAINLSQGSPEIDLVLNQGPEAVADDVSFSDSSDYHEVAFGGYPAQILGPNNEVLLETDVNLGDQQAYTLVVFDRPGSLQAKLFQDTFDIDSGQINIRLFNTAVGTDPLALYFLPEDGGTPTRITGDVAYGNASEQVPFDDGNHNVALDVDADGVVDAQYDLPLLSDGTLANLYAVFDENGDLDLVLQMNDGFTWDLDSDNNIGGGNDADVRVLHLIPNLPQVNVFTAGATIASGLEFMEISPVVGIPSGEFDVAVGPSLEAPLFTINDADFEARTDYSVVLFGNTMTPTGAVLVDDNRNIPAGMVRIRMVHTAADVGELDFYTVPGGGEPQALFTDLGYGEASATLDLAPAVARIGVDANNDNVFDVFFDMPSLPAGELVNIFAVMDNGNPRLVTQTSAGLVSIAAVMQ